MVSDKIYLTGSPCKRGHTSGRYKSSRACAACIKAYNRSESHKAWRRSHYKAKHRKPTVSETRLMTGEDQKSLYDRGFLSGYNAGMTTKYAAPTVYDITTDLERAVTQADLDELQHIHEAFGDLIKLLKFRNMEAVNGLITPGKTLKAIMEDVVKAEQAARGERILQTINTDNGKQAFFLIPDRI